MELLAGIVLVVCGALCIPSVIAKKNPKAAEMLGKIAPFQGIIGIIILLWGIWGVIWSIMTIRYIAQGWPIWWIVVLASNAMNVLLGFLLGFGLIQQKALANASAEVKAKAEETYKKLVASQGNLGIIGIIVGLVAIVYNILYMIGILRI